MPRFYFNFREGPFYLSDDIGAVFANVEEVYLEAFRTAQDMWSDLLVQRQDPLACAFEITDSANRQILVLPFAEILESCRGVKRSPPTIAGRPIST